MKHSIVELVQGVLDGNRLLLSRTLSLVENEAPGSQAVLSQLFAHTSRSHIIGVTGAPGTGKSTLVTMLVQRYRRRGLTVAVVAIDPTSPFTGGALLGDRVRMRALSGDSGVFIRSMATRGTLGGLSKTTSDVIWVLDAAGFERIIVETVGVGQAEVEIARTAHSTVVVEAPGLGDEVQAIKAGVLEIADILVVNKADRPSADRTVRALEMMMAEGMGMRAVGHHGQVLRVESLPPDTVHDEGPADAQVGENALKNENGWSIPILKTVATATGGDDSGVDALRQRIEEHRAWLLMTGEMQVRERLRIVNGLENIIRAELNRRIQATLPEYGLDDVVAAIQTRQRDPYTTAHALLAGL